MLRNDALKGDLRFLDGLAPVETGGHVALTAHLRGTIHCGPRGLPGFHPFWRVGCVDALREGKVSSEPMKQGWIRW
jgi:hypothetical protein